MRGKKYAEKYKAKEGTSSLVRVNIMIPRNLYDRLVEIKKRPGTPSMSFIITKDLEKNIKLFEKRTDWA